MRNLENHISISSQHLRTAARGSEGSDGRAAAGKDIFGFVLVKHVNFCDLFQDLVKTLLPFF